MSHKTLTTTSLFRRPFKLNQVGHPYHTGQKGNLQVVKYLNSSMPTGRFFAEMNDCMQFLRSTENKLESNKYSLSSTIES